MSMGVPVRFVVAALLVWGLVPGLARAQDPQDPQGAQGGAPIAPVEPLTRPGIDAWPARAPDLYLGEPLIVTARSGRSAGPVAVSGLRGGSAWTDSFPAAADVKGAGIANSRGARGLACTS